MKAKRWRPAGGGLSPHVREGGKRKIAPVPLSDDSKARLLEYVLVLLWFCHSTQRDGRCPRNGIGKITRPGSHHVIDPEGGAGPQHARDFGGQFCLEVKQLRLGSS
jgi:hypothetical protein